MNNIVLITGANRGIGSELSRCYHSQGAQVIAVCRETSDEIENIAELVISGIDLALDDAMDTVLQVLSMAYNQDFNIDILINNAGLFQNETLEAMNYEQIRQQFEVNTLAPLKAR